MASRPHRLQGLPLTGAAHGPMEFPSLSPRIVEGPSRLSNDTAMRPTNMSGLGTFATWRGTGTKSALATEADFHTLVRVEPVYGFRA
jgi:hypothetical protein